MQYTRNPYKSNTKTPNFASIVLNEKLVETLNSQQQQITDVQSVYNEALDKLYDQIPLQDLVELLWKIYEKYDVQSFVSMTRAQLALYGRYRLVKIPDPHYVLLASHCFYKIQNDVFFTRLPQTTQQLLKTSLTSLPSSLQYLFGKRAFCLQSERYWEVLYQTTDHQINGETSLVLTSLWNKINAVYMGLIEPVFEQSKEDNLVDLNLSLVSKHLRGYFHRLPGHNNKIGANDSKRELKNCLWSVELVDDNQLAFKQDEYLMCRQENGVFALKEKTIYDRECQWSAGECKAPTTPLSFYIVLVNKTRT